MYNNQQSFKQKSHPRIQIILNIPPNLPNKLLIRRPTYRIQYLRLAFPLRCTTDQRLRKFDHIPETVLEDCFMVLVRPLIEFVVFTYYEYCDYGLPVLLGEELGTAVDLE